MTDLRVGMSQERHYTVTEKITAAAFFENDNPGLVSIPAVWASPDMIARMEVVAATVVAPHLEPGQFTVGARNEVSHLAPTPIGLQVRVRATLTKIEGRRLTFAVEAFDEKEKVGEGIHVRHIVDRMQFESRLARKQP